MYDFQPAWSDSSCTIPWNVLSSFSVFFNLFIRAPEATDILFKALKFADYSDPKIGFFGAVHAEKSGYNGRALKFVQVATIVKTWLARRKNHRQLLRSIPRLSAPSRHLLGKISPMYEKNVPIVVILPSRWQDGAESPGMERTSCLWKNINAVV